MGPTAKLHISKATYPMTTTRHAVSSRVIASMRPILRNDTDERAGS